MGTNDKIFQNFLTVYFVYLEELLNRESASLSNLVFQSEEANTDEELKAFLQAFISLHPQLDCSWVKSFKIVTNDVPTEIDCDTFENFKIADIFLPKQLSANHKAAIGRSKSSVYTNPDLLIRITNGSDEYFESIELKSTKDNKIPGSSVQQVAPFEWVIFVSRRTHNVEVSIGRYINCITNKLPFPDRSPRPEIGYNTLKNWNATNRSFIDHHLTIFINTVESIEKARLLTDWQDYLASEWMEIVKDEQSRQSERWFKNAIRKFAIKFLDFTIDLSDQEIETLKAKLKSQIK